jgi:zinc protease
MRMVRTALQNGRTRWAGVAIVMAMMAQAAYALPQIEHWTTPNGAEVYFVPMRGLPMLDVRVDLDAGGVRSPADQLGVAGLTAALLDAGARLEGQPVAESAIADRFADVGAQYSAVADSDKASVSLRVLSSKTERDPAIALLASVLAAPLFPEEVFERERARSIAALREAATQPASILANRFAQRAYGAHPYGRPLLPEHLERLSVSDVRAFHQQYYRAQAAVITLVGDVQRAEAEQLAAKLVAQLPKGAPRERVPDAGVPTGVVERISHPAAQAHVAIGLPAVARNHPDSIALMLGNYVLGGGGFVSRLTQEIRDRRGLAYSVYSGLAPGLSQGPFQIGLQTKAAQADEAVRVARAVLERFVRDGPTEEELAAAKQFFVQGQAVGLDTNRKLLGQVASIAYYRSPLDAIETFATRVQAVSREQVLQAFQKHVLMDSLVTVIVGGEAARE